MVHWLFLFLSCSVLVVVFMFGLCLYFIVESIIFCGLSGVLLGTPYTYNFIFALYLLGFNL